MNSEEAWEVLKLRTYWTRLSESQRDQLECDLQAEYERGKAEREPLEMLEALAKRYIDISIAPPKFDLSVWWRDGEMVYFMVRDGKEYEGTRDEAAALLKGQQA